jgi:hypothetical protein
VDKEATLCGQLEFAEEKGWGTWQVPRISAAATRPDFATFCRGRFRKRIAGIPFDYVPPRGQRFVLRLKKQGIELAAIKPVPSTADDSMCSYIRMRKASRCAAVVQLRGNGKSNWERLRGLGDHRLPPANCIDGRSIQITKLLHLVAKSGYHV